MDALTTLSNSIASIVEKSAPSVVQVQGRRRHASGVVFDKDVVVTMASTLGRNDGLHVRAQDGRALDAELAGWDPATGLAVLRVPGLNGSAAAVSSAKPRVGSIAIAVARSWSNVVTATSGIVAIIGGPLRTGRGKSIETIIRTTAPMHDGFSGGAFLDDTGALAGIATASSIRGLGVVIPAAIAWDTARALLQHGHIKRGYLGIASQPVQLPENQRPDASHDEGLLVASVTPASPAAAAGVLVGDVIVEFDGVAVASPEDLLDLLAGERVGRSVAVRLIRGGTLTTVTIAVAERPST